MVWGRVLFKGRAAGLCARSRFVVVVCFVIAFVLFGSVVQYSESRADRAADLVPVVLPLEESVVPEVPLGEEPGVGDVWKPINTDVSGRGVFSWLGVGGAKVDEHPLGPVFAETASDKNVLTVSRGGSRIGFTLVGAAGSKLKRDLWPWSGQKDRVEYEGVFPD